MSNFAYQCCCEAGQDTCPSSNCPCATSYTVSNINLSYILGYDLRGIDCVKCVGQSFCQEVGNEINVTFVQTEPFVVTRRVCPVSGTCGWYGTGSVLASGTVVLNRERKCMPGSLNRVCDNTITFEDIEVDICVHVTCSTTAREGCAGVLVPPGQRVWVHKIEICPFTIKCTDHHECGHLVDGACTICGFTCDSLGANCDSQSLSVNCAGGHYTWISEYKCLDLIQDGEWDTRGFYQSGFRCEAPCTPVSAGSSLLDVNVATYGAFAIYLADECDPNLVCNYQGAINPCNYVWLFPAGNLLNDQTSYCGGVDVTLPLDPSQPACPAEIQYFTGGGLVRWNYA